MNIFFLDRDPLLAAQYHNNKHVVKMILETAQLLSTAHRVLDGTLVGKKYVLPDSREDALYKATHIKHPSAVWCRSGIDQYRWTFDLFHHLLDEYSFRYSKEHASSRLVGKLWDAPNNINFDAPWTQPTPAMPDECKIPGDSVSSYRIYYMKHKSHIAQWKERSPPWWYQDYSTINKPA